MIPWEDVLTTARLAAGLPPFLGSPVTVDEARTVVRQRLERRSSDFLALLSRLYAQTAGPYHALLTHAGLEFGDLASMVRQNGVEGALRTLLRQGVYLTLEELKARRPVTRGSLSITVDPRTLRNPATRVVLASRTSGGRGAGTAVPMDLVHLRDRSIDTLLAMDARGGSGWTKAQWLVPGGGALAQLLEFSAFGPRVSRWFTQVDPAGLAARYRWSARVVRWASLARGMPLPPPEHVAIDDPSRILGWLRATLRGGTTPHLFTFASSALRLCEAAEQQGDDLAGVQFTVTGEPLTATRLAAIRRRGATALPRYAITECGAVGYGCAAPAEPDEVHVPRDLHAVIRAEDDAVRLGVTSRSLLVTSLRPTAPLLLLNAHMGDQAELGSRDCGCTLERLGWSTHLHAIRSDQKLTAGGMTFLQSDLLPILDESLPGRFGGGPGDYQLVEDEAPDGRPRVRLLVRPGVGPDDLMLVEEAFLSAVGAASEAERVMSLAWRHAGLLRAERVTPIVLASGKVRPVHVLSRVAVRR